MLNNNYRSLPETGSGCTSGSFQFHDFWDSIWGRKNVVLAVFSLVLIATVYFTIKTTPQYLSTATMMVESKDDNDILKDNASIAKSMGFTNRTRISNYVEILKSSTLAQKVLAKAPEVLEANLGSASGGQAIDKLRKGLSVRNLRETDIIQVQYLADRPDLSQTIANAYTETYQEYEFDQTRANVRSIREFIQTQFQAVSNRLDSAEKELESFKCERKLVSLSAETEAAISRQSNFQVLFEQTRSDRMATEEQLNYIKNLLADDQKTLPVKLENISSPLITNLKSTLTELEVQRTNLLLQGFDLTHPRIKSLEQRINEIKNRLSQESINLISGTGGLGAVDPLNRIQSLFQSTFDLEIESERLKAREKVLSNLVATYETELADLPIEERNLAKLTRQVDVNREVYLLLSQRYEEVRISEVGKISAIRIIDWAAKGVKIKPNIPLNIIFGLILAISLAIGSGLGLEYLDTTIKRTEEAEKILPVVLANIPNLKISNGKKPKFSLRPHTAGKIDFISHRHLLMVNQLNDQFDAGGAEAFRMLRTAVLYSEFVIRNSEFGKTVLVTSPGVSEGKSTVAINLAVVLAQAGNKTLLVDADLRRPVLHSVFQRHKQPGFTDAVVTGKSPAETVSPSGIENLDIMTCGTLPPSPADILNSKSTTELLERLKENYNFIIIDTPPTLVAADTAILASKTDGVILTIKANKTTREALGHAQKVLMTAGAKFIGGVINCLKAPKRYGYYYCDYKYKYNRPKETKTVTSN